MSSAKGEQQTRNGNGKKIQQLIEAYTNTKGNTTQKPKAEFLKLQQA